MQRWSQVRSKEHSSMSEGKARGGGENWHGREAILGTGLSPSCSSKLRAALGCCGTLHWYPPRVPNQIALGIQYHSIQFWAFRMLQRSNTSILQGSVLPPPSPPTAPAPPATSSCSPSAPQTGRTGPPSCPWHGKAARAPGCCPCRAGRDQEGARKGSGMLCGQVLPRGRCQQCLLGPTGTSPGQEALAGR